MRLRRPYATFLLVLQIGILIPILGLSRAEGSAISRDYVVLLKSQPDTSAIARIPDLTQRRTALVQKLKDNAFKTQAPILDLLQKEQAAGRVQTVSTNWMINLISFRGQEAVASALTGRSDVERVSVDEVVTIRSEAAAGQALWNLVRTRVSGAGGAWDQGFSGAGIVVANIDTGVDFSHPDLEPKFRGRPAPGEQRFHHNWRDFSEGTRYPIDVNGHGTHVMGVMVGGDGPGPLTPDVGIAYGAKWIAARAFNSKGESTTAQVLAAAEWMLAPTDLNGLTPRPDLAPDIVNNSWGAGRFGDNLCRPWFRLMIKRWREAEILPVFSVGDSAGGTEPHSPGHQSQSSLTQLEKSASFSVGATDQNDARAAFSSEIERSSISTCQDAAGIKPNVLAPGISIYSTAPGGAPGSPIYATKSGTSMAAPHVAGTAALMLQSAGGGGSIGVNDYRIDQEITQSAPQVATNCAFMCRRLDALAAVQAVRRNGILTGRVTYLENGIAKPLAGAKVSAIATATGAVARSAITDSTGTYLIGNLGGPNGTQVTYEVEVRGPVTVATTGEVIGWIRQKLTGAFAVSIGNADTVRRDFSMERAPNRSLEGDIMRWASGDKVAGVTVKLDGTPLSASSDSSGHFRFPAVPDPSIPDPGSGDLTTDYDLVADGDRCADQKRESIVIAGSDRVTGSNPNFRNIVRAVKRDAFGYHCIEKEIDWVAGNSPLSIRADDAYVTVGLPFAFPFYGTNRSEAYISTNGFVRFDKGSAEFDNTALPTVNEPNTAAYVFWDDLAMDDKSQILTATTADAFVIEWRRMTFAPRFSERITFSLTLHRNGDVELQYLNSDGSFSATGQSATIGIENTDGRVASQYSRSEPIVASGKSILYSSAMQIGEIRGLVMGTDGLPVASAAVTATESGVRRTVRTNALGRYRLPLKAGTYSVSASSFRYAEVIRTGVVVTDGNLPSCFPSSICPVDFTNANALPRRPGFSVSGYVVDQNGGVVADAVVSLGNPNVPTVVTDADGHFIFFDIPNGSYGLDISGTRRCVFSEGTNVTVSGAEVTRNLSATVIRDAFGYTCRDNDPIDTSHETGVLQISPLNGDDVSTEFALPFTFPFYGHAATRAFVSSNGFVRFDKASSQTSNTNIPNSAEPNFVQMPFFDDLQMDQSSRIQTRSDGATYYVIEWVDLIPLSSPGSRVTFETILHPSGNFEFQYRVADPETNANGAGASIGLENRSGSDGLKYSVNEAAVEGGRRIEFFRYVFRPLPGPTPSPTASPTPSPSPTIPPPGSSGVLGIVRDTGGAGLSGVAIDAGCGTTCKTTTNAFGEYGLTLNPGSYTLTVTKFGYGTQQRTVQVTESSYTTLDITMIVAGATGLYGVITDQNGRTVGGIEMSFQSLPKSPLNPPVVFFADAAGGYVLNLPGGSYELTFPGRCVGASNPAVPFQITLTSGTTQRNFQVSLLEDSFGYTCVNKSVKYTPGLVPIPLLGPGTTVFGGGGGLNPVYLPRVNGYGDDTVVTVPLGFDFPFYGKNRRLAHVSVDGFVSFDNEIVGLNGPSLNILRAPELISDGAEIYVGQSGLDGFVVEWRSLRFGDSPKRVSFQMILYSSGDVGFLYRTNSDYAAEFAEVGLSDGCGGASLVYASKVPGSLRLNQGIVIRPPTVSKPSYSVCPPP